MIKVKLDDDRVLAALTNVAAHFDDLTDLMNEIGEQVEYQTEQRFDQGIDPDGNPWMPKSPTTLAAYERRGQIADVRPLFGPNVDGTPLRASIYRQYGRDFVEVGTNKIQAAVMQFGAAKGAFGVTSRGGSIPWGTIPARPFLGISEVDRSNIVATTEEWLEGLVPN